MKGEHERFCDRLKLAMGEQSGRSLALKSDMSPTVVAKYINGESTPNVERLVALARALNVSVEWLATGDGDTAPSGCSINEAAGNLDTDEFAKVNLYDAEVSMGSGSWSEDDRVIHPIAFRRDWLKSQSLDPNKCAAILARGDSMEPTIVDGATLLIDLADNTISRDGVYVIRFDGHLLAKRLQRSFDGSVFIKSDNPVYEKVHVASSQVNDINIVGRVVWYASVI
ncbi:helix-turn-helix transcriptional regulator [Hydrogenovibrio sp. 3SP14C1]|uniref:XRE family transcriptional regulator n=1 Tax=Hydrogenovibrio sp. 3SP14C1 TaxID=3038774 RepID=UPI002417612E|nr:helix-turn-helix transcriptional regulator [Hydrogenovibrio sp. 3SP14C1]MDG4811689.1 helix-turn-helix transcriptional regulator [Hydrogenovibrio sp. 3SP14C1]